MSNLIHLIVGNDLREKLQEKLGEDFEEIAGDIDNHIKREVDMRRDNETPYGFHRAVVGNFRIHFDCENMEDANKKMKQMSHALQNCHPFSTCVDYNLTYKTTKGDTIDYDE